MIKSILAINALLNCQRLPRFFQVFPIFDFGRHNKSVSRIYIRITSYIAYQLLIKISYACTRELYTIVYIYIGTTERGAFHCYATPTGGNDIQWRWMGIINVSSILIFPRKTRSCLFAWRQRTTKRIFS